jgi:hypothetical protein
MASKSKLDVGGGLAKQQEAGLWCILDECATEKLVTEALDISKATITKPSIILHSFIIATRW